MTAPLRFLIAENEPSSAREVRRCSVGRSSGETYLNVLKSLAPGAHCDRIKPADTCADLPGDEALAGYDGIFLTGSPLHLYEATTATRREVVFMRDVFASGTPSFGSCAGLQVATVAAGGSVRQNVNGREAAFARRITPTEAGRVHPLLEGRPAAFDAPAIHTDEVESLPEGALLLASNGVTSVQAAEIRSGDEGVFWGFSITPRSGSTKLPLPCGARRRTLSNADWPAVRRTWRVTPGTSTTFTRSLSAATWRGGSGSTNRSRTNIDAGSNCGTSSITS